MDILAARKKAAEKARQADGSTAGPPAPRTEPAAAFPLPPDTTYTAADEPVPAPTPETVPASEPMAAQPAGVVLASDDSGPAPVPDANESAQTGAPLEERLLEMLAFQLGSEEYAVPVESVREVLTPREITPVPHAPDHLLGVCSLRGVVLPIIDLGKRLGLTTGGRDDRSRIIVTGDVDDRVGLIVDRIHGVVRFSSGAVRPAPETIEQGAEYLAGIARKDDHLYILLDVEKAVTT